jgi:hypothetical protein
MAMATDLPTIGPDAADADSVTHEPQLFRFRLRQLLAVVTLICLFLAAVVSSSGLAAAVLILATLVVIFHIFSTALATRLREHTDQSISWQATIDEESGRRRSDADQTVGARMPRSPWHARASTPLPWLPRFVIGVSLCGGILGALVLAVTNDRQASPAGIAVGAISIAVVAGWFAFVGYSFYGVFRHGLRQAMAEERHDPPT